jgi:hypothetical protein
LDGHEKEVVGVLVEIVHVVLRSWDAEGCLAWDFRRNLVYGLHLEFYFDLFERWRDRQLFSSCGEMEWKIEIPVT